MSIDKFTSYKVTGNTYAFRSELGSIGGRWDAPSKSWIVRTGGMSAISQQRYVLDTVRRAGCVVEKVG